MIVNSNNLAAMFVGYNTHFNKGFEGVAPDYKDIAMVVPSRGREEKYAWIGQIPGFREWIGPRVVKNLELHDYTIKNRSFEDTISVPRDDVEDDLYGLLTPFFSEMGRLAAEFPNKLVFDVLSSGFTARCYDGQEFFDTDHPVITTGEPDGPVVSVSNMQAGSDTPWFLLDTSRAIKPVIYQERRPPVLVKKDQPSDDNVFMNKEFLYGTDMRGNAGLGLWQLAFGSKQPLTAENYEAARAAMMAFKGDGGRPLGIKPNTLVVGPGLEGAAMRLLNSGSRVILAGEDDAPVAVQNEWANSAKLIVTSYLA